MEARQLKDLSIQDYLTLLIDTQEKPEYHQGEVIAMTGFEIDLKVCLKLAVLRQIPCFKSNENLKT